MFLRKGSQNYFLTFAVVFQTSKQYMKTKMMAAVLTMAMAVAAMRGMLDPEYEEKVIGSAEVRHIR